MKAISFKTKTFRREFAIAKDAVAHIDPGEVRAAIQARVEKEFSNETGGFLSNPATLTVSETPDGGQRCVVEVWYLVTED